LNVTEETLENQDETEADEVVAEEAANPDAPERRKGVSVFAGLLLGGALAAVLGFAAARSIVPEGWPFPGVTPEPDPLAIAVEQQSARVDNLDSRLVGFADRMAALEGDTSVADLRANLKTATARIDNLTGVINAIDARLLEVEKIPRGSGTEAAEAAARAYERELSAMRELLDGELAQIRATQEAANADSQSAQAAAQEAATRAALAQVLAALDSGQPFDTALATLADVSGKTSPAGLAETAKAGVVTLNALQASYPEAARAALAASITALVAEGKIGRFEGFMRSQLGTRSLEPKQGGMDAALAEIAALPEAGQAKMADWVASAKSRAETLAAIQALTADLNTQ